MFLAQILVTLSLLMLKLNFIKKVAKLKRGAG